MNHLAYIALIITGLHVCTWPGMLLERPRVWAANGLDKLLGMKWSRYVQKPLWDCLPCMASVWGVTIGWDLGLFVNATFSGIGFYLLALCGLLKVMETITGTPDDRVGAEA